jgi:hypothetical protein
MKTLKFYGANDNQIYAGPVENVDQFDNGACAMCEAHAGRFLVSAGDDKICVHAIYAGSWGFAVTSENGQDDYETLPGWKMRRAFGVDVRYSETLEIDVPDNAELRWLE